MPKRLVDTELWNDENIIENFTAEDKYFWLYLLTSPHNTICGVLKNSPVLIARDMGLHKDTIVNLIYRFENYHHLIFCDKTTNEMFILNWYKYNWTKSPKIISLVEREMENIKSIHIRDLLKDRVNEIQGVKQDTLSIPYRYPPNTIPNTNTNSIYISKKESKYINKCVRESYDDIIGNSELGEKVQDALREFIQHCCLNKNAPTNSKLKGIIQALKGQYKTDDEMVNSLNKAVNGGYFDIKRETAETTTTAEKVDVDEVLRKRKLHAETVAQDNLDNMLKDKEFKKVYEELNGLEKELAFAEINSDKEKMSYLLNQRTKVRFTGTMILQNNGFEWEDLQPRYHCEKCKDTGWIGTKECTCRKELRGSYEED